MSADPRAAFSDEPPTAYGTGGGLLAVPPPPKAPCVPYEYCCICCCCCPAQAVVFAFCADIVAWGATVPCGATSPNAGFDSHVGSAGIDMSIAVGEPGADVSCIDEDCQGIMTPAAKLSTDVMAGEIDSDTLVEREREPDSVSVAEEECGPAVETRLRRRALLGCCAASWLPPGASVIVSSASSAMSCAPLAAAFFSPARLTFKARLRARKSRFSASLTRL
jgi:hypothetical protein